MRRTGVVSLRLVVLMRCQVHHDAGSARFEAAYNPTHVSSMKLSTMCELRLRTADFWRSGGQF